MSEQLRRSRPTCARLQLSTLTGSRPHSSRAYSKGVYNRRFRRAHRGQTLVVALSVLFILLFIGGIFVTRVARNLTDSARGRDLADARALAEAGLKYCDNELNAARKARTGDRSPARRLAPTAASPIPTTSGWKKALPVSALKVPRPCARVL